MSSTTEPSLFDQAVALAQANDPACAGLVARCTDPEVLGELLTAVHGTGSAAGRAAVTPVLERPFARGAWQGWKRIHKRVEGRLLESDEPDDTPGLVGDAALWALGAHGIDVAAGYVRPISGRTLWYLRRRAVRTLKRLGHRRPARLRLVLAALLPRYAPETPTNADTPRQPGSVLARLLRKNVPLAASAQDERFSARLENPYDAAPSTASELDVAALLALGDADLVRAAPAPKPAPPPAPAAPTHARRPRGRGPLFAEVWAREPAWLVDLLRRTVHPAAAEAIAALLAERVGEALAGVELEAFYALLEHPVEAAWRLGLAQIAARARRGVLRWGELAALVRRDPVRWDVVTDVLLVLDDERAEAEWAGLAERLRDLVVAHPDHPGAGALVLFLRRRLAARLGPPLFSQWDGALKLVASARPDVATLGRELVAKLAEQVPLDAAGLRKLLDSRLCRDDPELVHRVLTTGAGYRPRTRALRADERATGWSLAECARALGEVSEAGFACARRAFLAWEEQGSEAGGGGERGTSADAGRAQSMGGLDPQVARSLVDSAARRVRALGLDLFGGAVRRGAIDHVAVARLLGSAHEDVVVWAREALETAAAAGRLPNEALYRVLDAAAADAQGFGRDLVRRHLEKFAVAELIVFCAESPDAATSDLGIGLYEQRLAGSVREGAAAFDLRALVPMFRILLYRPATARAEKERLYGTLGRWALAGAANARLVVDVVAELRRTESRVDMSRAVSLMARVADRFADVAVPFTTARTFTGQLKVRA